MAALQAESKDKEALEEARFRSMILALHLDKAKKIFDVLDNVQRDNTGFAPELTDEEMENYQPYSAEEADEAIRMLRTMGVAVQ